MKKKTQITSLIVPLVAVPISALAVPTVFNVNLTELNNSGVTGSGSLVLDGNALTVNLSLVGLESGVQHAQHIHGRFDGMNNPIDSVTPTIADDSDGDGFVEVLEGLPAYGDVILPLSIPPASGNDASTVQFPTPNLDGTLFFEETYNLGVEGQFFSPVSMADYDGVDLLPLSFREIVIHGLTVDGSAGAGTTGEIDGTAGYKAVLPIAAGEITAVPEPQTYGLLAGVVALGFTALRRRSRS